MFDRRLCVFQGHFVDVLFVALFVYGFGFIFACCTPRSISYYDRCSIDVRLILNWCLNDVCPLDQRHGRWTILCFECWLIYRWWEVVYDIIKEKERWTRWMLNQFTYACNTSIESEPCRISPAPPSESLSASPPNLAQISPESPSESPPGNDHAQRSCDEDPTTVQNSMRRPA